MNLPRSFSVLVFVILKNSLFLVSFVGTSGSSMPLFSSFKAFETINRSLNETQSLMHSAARENLWAEITTIPKSTSL